MILEYLANQQTGILFFLAVLLAIELSNLRSLRSLEDYPHAGQLPFISVLVPARDEAHQIEACLRSLLDQDYPHFEVIVLDDESRDGTGAIIQRLAEEYHRLEAVQGRPLPEGWAGKNWACQQLAEQAKGDLLLFTDADTRHHPLMLRSAAAAMQASQADLLTGLPRQEVPTLGEQLIIPVLAWANFALLPVGLARSWRFPWLSYAVGQFLLFRRQAYQAVGGHAAVRSNPLEDFALARLVKKKGFHLEIAGLTGRVSCRMYQGLRQALRALPRYMLLVFGNNLLLFLFVGLWLLVVFFQPLLGLALSLMGRPLPGFSVPLALVNVALSILVWALSNWRFRLPLTPAFFYPLTVLLMEAAMALALWRRFLGRPSHWKGRPLPVQSPKVEIR